MSTANACPRCRASSLGQTLRVAIEQRQRRPFRGEELGGAASDTGRRAGDHDPAVAQAIHFFGIPASLNELAPARDLRGHETRSSAGVVTNGVAPILWM